MVSSLKAEQKAIWKSNGDVAAAIMEKIEFGQQSEYLTQLTVKELRAMKGEELLSRFREVQQYACDVIYSGQLPAEEVAQAVVRTLETGEHQTFCDSRVMQGVYERTLEIIKAESLC
jgi:hypothetical protein